MNRARRIPMLVLPLISATTALAAQPADTIRVGSPALRAASPVVGTYAIESFRRVDGVDTPTSTTTQSVDRGRFAGEDVYIISTHHASADGDTTRSSIVIRAADFSLLHHRVKAARDSAAVTANRGHLTGWVALPGEPIRLLDQPLDHPVFPIEGQIPWLFPVLPLEDGYTAAIPHFSEWEGGESWKSVRVIGSETVEREGRQLECWKVDGGELFPGFRVTYWVDKGSRHIVQGVARGTEPGPEFWSRARASHVPEGRQVPLRERP